jgi:UDP-2-acetamido-2,6-beta-L-arabino-hexul-4-ose reductase
MIDIDTKKLNKRQDERGWLAEILRGEDVEPKAFGQLIVTTALPGKSKGNHYHLRKREWYCVVRGKALLLISSLDMKERQTLEMSAENPLLVEVPRGYLHTISNIGDEEMILIAYTNEPFDPDDQDTFYVNDTKQ